MLKKLTALFIALSVIFGFAGCTLKNQEKDKTGEKQSSESCCPELESIHQRYLSLDSKTHYDGVTQLVDEMNDILFDIISNCSNNKQNNYYNDAIKAKYEALSAFENLIYCVFDTGSIGKTLYPRYEYYVTKRLIENVYTTVDGEYIPVPVDFQVSDMFDGLNGEYYNNLVSIKERIDCCTDTDDAISLLNELDIILKSAEENAYADLKNDYAPLGSDKVEQMLDCLDKYLSHRKTAEEQYVAASKHFSNKMFTFKTELYAKYETAQWLAAIIRE